MIPITVYHWKLVKRCKKAIIFFFKNIEFQDSTNGIKDATITVSDSKIHCSFLRDTLVNLQLPTDLGEATIDLNNKEYFVMVASGPLDANGFVAKHSAGKGVSENPFVITK